MGKFVPDILARPYVRTISARLRAVARVPATVAFPGPIAPLALSFAPRSPGESLSIGLPIFQLQFCVAALFRFGLDGSWDQESMQSHQCCAIKLISCDKIRYAESPESLRVRG